MPTAVVSQNDISGLTDDPTVGPPDAQIAGEGAILGLLRALCVTCQILNPNQEPSITLQVVPIVPAAPTIQVNPPPGLPKK